MHDSALATSHSDPLLRLTQLPHLSDEDLMSALQAGEQDALAVLFDRYHRLIYSIARKIVRDSSEAEDVMQNVFFEIFRSAAQFDPAKGTCKGWLLQYAYHRSINRRQQLNARSFYGQTSVDDIKPELCQKTSSFGRLSQGDVAHLIRQGLETLNEKQRNVIFLASYEGLTMREISARTNESLLNVRHHFYRGLKKLRSFVAANQPRA